MALICVMCACAQNLLTNTIAELKISKNKLDDVGEVMTAISRAYNVRICTESQYGKRSVKMPHKEIVFTNATFGYVLNTIMTNTIDLTWRYENNADSIYVYPKTNAISMMRCGPIHITNLPAKRLFDVYDIFDLGLNTIYAIEFESGEGSMTHKVTLDFGETHMWQVLDAIEQQVMFASPWEIWENQPHSYHRYYISYFPRHHENWWTNRIEYQNQ